MDENEPSTMSLHEEKVKQLLAPIFRLSQMEVNQEVLEAIADLQKRVKDLEEGIK